MADPRKPSRRQLSLGSCLEADLTQITQERAERIARGHACDHCGEYSFKKIKVKPAGESHRKALGEVWHVTKECGICGMFQEIGIDAEGDIVYAT